MGFKVIQYQVV